MSRAHAEEAIRQFITNSDARDLVFADIQSDILEAIIASDPHETDKRESLYFQLRALILVEAKMQSLVEAPVEREGHAH